MQLDQVRDSLPRLQFQQFLFPVIDSLAGKVLQPDSDFGAVTSGNGIITEGHGHLPLGPRQLLHGPLHLPDIEPVITESQRQPHTHQQHTPARIISEKQPAERQHKSSRSAGQQPFHRQQVLRQKDAQGKGACERGENSHFPFGGVGSSVRPRR